MAEKKTLKDMKKLLRIIYPLLLNYESGQINISECSLKLGVYLDEYRDEIDHFIEVGAYPPELQAIIFRINRCGIHNTLIKQLVDSQEEFETKTKKAMERLKESIGYDDPDIKNLETALRNTRLIK